MPRHSAFDSDVAVLGGGCAGLSLAARLAGGPLRTTVIEPRTRYTDDRTWSFWRTAGDPFTSCTRARWGRWAVTANGERVVRSSPRLRYESLSAAAFYDRALHSVASAPNVEIRLGTSVVAEPRAINGGFAIATDDGECRARIVIDTRPAAAEFGFGQYFLGLEVELDGAVFDETTVELMDFAAARPERVDFLYVLPFARDRALIEATSFAQRAPAPGELAAQLDAAVARLSDGRAIRRIRREQGFIPMQPQAAHTAATTPHPGWLRAGIAGGAARPSTGYAFQRIQRATDLLATQLLAGDVPTPPVLDGPVTRWMDGLFLRVLRRWPAKGPELFLTLFKRAPAERLERFMSGSTASQDRLAVIGALPPAPFLRELLSA